MNLKAYNRYFLIGCCLYWLAIIGFSSVGPDQQWYLFLISLLLIFSTAAHLWFFAQYSRFHPIVEVEVLFTKVAAFGGLTLFSALLPRLFGFSNLGPYSWLNYAIVYIIINYFLYALVIFRKLIYLKRTNAVIRQWQTFMTVLFITSLGNILGFKLPEILLNILLIAGILIWLPLLIRIKWIALLEANDKWPNLLFTLVISLINIGLFGLLRTMDVPFLNTHSPVNIFATLVIFAVTSYSVLSLLTIIFYMPLSSVIEEQKSEIQSFQEISKLLQNKEGSENTLKQLFSVCYNNTFSSSGWLVYNSNGKGEIQHTNNITSKEIQLISDRINLGELLQIETKDLYYNFPDLEAKKIVMNGEMPFQSLLVLPIYTADSELKGAICLLKNFTFGFDADMVNLTRSYIDQARLAFENDRLIKQTIEDARYKEEIEIATKVQQLLMPKEFPANEYCEIAAFNKTAKDVGGDYYDYSVSDDYRMSIVIGDVSGKGAAAAFHMAQMRGIFQSLMQLCLPPDNFLVMANQTISRCLEKNQFITLLYVAFDFAFQNFTYSRGGHCPLLYYNAETDTVSYLQGEGLGLGIIRNNSYTKFVEATEYPLHENDILLLYTDGLVEGRKPDSNEQFGYERLKFCLEAYKDMSAKEITDAVYKKFINFTEDNDTLDDTAIMVVKIKKGI